MTVVSDTSVLRYLLTLGQADLLLIDERVGRRIAASAGLR